MFEKALKILDIPINAVLLAILMLSLAKNYPKFRGVTIDIEGHGREDILEKEDYSRTIGWFTILYPITLTLPEGGKDILSVLSDVYQVLRKIPHNGFDYLLNENKNNKNYPRPQIKFNYLGRFQTDENKLFSLDLSTRVPQISPENILPYLLDIEIASSENGMFFTWHYSSKHFKEIDIKKISNNYNDILCKFIETTNKTNPNFSLEKFYPLLPLQSGLLFQSIGTSSTANYLQANIVLKKNTDINFLKKSWQLLMNIHAALRASFVYQSENYLTRINKNVVLAWEELDWSIERRDAEKQLLLKKLMKHDRKKGFDIYQAPLFRIYCIHWKSNEYLLLLSYHHIIFDAWSFSLIVGHLNAIYQALSNQTRCPFISQSLSEDYYRWIYRQDHVVAKDYWKYYLNDLSENTFIPFNSNQWYKKNNEYEVTKSLDISEDILKSFLSKNGVSLNTVLNLSLGLLIRYLTGKEDVVFGTVISLRPIEIKAITEAIGLYVNTVPVRLKLKDDNLINLQLRSLQETLIQHEKFGYYPLHKIKKESSLSPTQPLFEILLVLENYPSIKKSIHNSIIKSIQIKEETHFSITLLVEIDKKITVKALSHENCYPVAFLNQLLDYYFFILEGVLLEKFKQVDQVTIFSEDTKKQLLSQYNKTYCAYPSSERFEKLVELQCQINPDTIAVIDEKKCWTYKELLEKIQFYEKKLSQYGCAPIIAISLERCVELVAILLAILRKGSAFLPIDASFSVKRIESILLHSNSPLIITDNKQFIFTKWKGIVVTTSQLDSEIIEKKSLVKLSPFNPSSIAYIIYTSGSTGEPKGVMIEHKSLINRIVWMRNYLKINEKDCILQKTSISFDVSVWELFLPLISGAILSLAEPNRHFDLKLSGRCNKEARHYNLTFCTWFSERIC